MKGSICNSCDVLSWHFQFWGYCHKGLHFSFPQTIADIAENRPFGFVHNCNLYFFCKFDFVFMYFCLTCQGCMLLRMGPLFSILRHQRPFSGPSHTLTGEQASNSLEISVLACLIYLDTWKIIKLDPYPSFLILVSSGSFIAFIQSRKGVIDEKCQNIIDDW